MAIELHEFAEEHLAKTFEWVSDPGLMAQMNYPAPISEEDHRSWFERIKKEHIFAIVSDDEHIGNCCLKGRDTVSKRAELWMYIGSEEDRGSGHGKEAIKQLLDFGFNDLGLNRVFLYVMGNNPGAESFYSKIGFEREGCLREHFMINGEYYDAIYMGMLKEGWVNGGRKEKDEHRSSSG